jgi:hypothetical protein
VDFWKYGLMQEENTILHQRSRMVWSRIQFTHLRHYQSKWNITKGHVFMIYAIVENVEVGWWCGVRVCVCEVPRCTARPLAVLFGWFGRVSVWWHVKQRPWDTTDTLSWPGTQLVSSPFLTVQFWLIPAWKFTDVIVHAMGSQLH